jgi:hypothetical protein
MKIEAVNKWVDVSFIFLFIGVRTRSVVAYVHEYNDLSLEVFAARSDSIVHHIQGCIIRRSKSNNKS